MFLLTIKLNSGNFEKMLVRANSKEDVGHLAAHYLDDGIYTVEDLSQFTDLGGAASHFRHLKDVGEIGPTGSHYDGDDRLWPGINIT